MNKPGDRSLLDPEFDTDSDASRPALGRAAPVNFDGEVDTDAGSPRPSSLVQAATASAPPSALPREDSMPFHGEISTGSSIVLVRPVLGSTFEGEASTDSALLARAPPTPEESPAFGTDPSTDSGTSLLPFADEGNTLAVDPPDAFRDEGSTIAVDPPVPFGAEDSSTPSIDQPVPHPIEVVAGQPFARPRSHIAPPRAPSMDMRNAVRLKQPVRSPLMAPAVLLAALAILALVLAVIWKEPDRSAERVSFTRVTPEASPKAEDRSLTGPLLSVQSDPPGARVSVRGQPAGLTPVLLRQPEGARKVPIELSLRGHKRFRAELAPDTKGHFGASVSLEPGVDLDAWLEKQGTRLLLVDFFASWCAPCVAELPHVKALADRYRQDGLRLIVVVTRDPGEGCDKLGFEPDDLVCDPDGAIARRFGAGEALPAADLWSWQGRLLERRARLPAIEKSIKSWIDRAPRAALEVEDNPAFGDTSSFTTLLADALLRADKLQILPTALQRARLDALRKEAFKARYDSGKQCDLGKEIPPNTLLRASAARIGGADMLSLQLFSTETSCLVGSSLSPFNASEPSASVESAVSELFSNLRGRIDMP